MGLLVNGQWRDHWHDTPANDGEFVREDSQFRHWITPTGEPGPSGKGGFKAEVGRYHLYVSLACPWAHRALIMRELKGLQDIISISIVHPDMHERGWHFANDFPGATGDELYGFQCLHQLYTKDDASYSGRVTVPVLWDKHTQCIVNNESSDIIRILNTAFGDLSGQQGDYYPQALRSDIDTINEFVYHAVNNGVYRVGFATTQAAYEHAFKQLFSALDSLDNRLSKTRYLVGEQLTEADWRLFTTLVRFDSVYFGHFKCNQQRIADYPHLSHYLRDLYQYPNIAQTVNLDHIKRHYYVSHSGINPSGIIPVGPFLNLDAPHDRECLTK